MSTAITINRPSRGSAPSTIAAAETPARRLDDPTPRRYWDARARLFAGRGAGLAAVCSYGMPWFYNWHIDLLQRRALDRWFRGTHRGSMLEIGCGVGRWTRRLAQSGHDVVGLDLSSIMVQEARRRAHEEAVDARCRFLTADSADIPLQKRFDRILAVTVLQHLLDPERFRASLEQLRDRLADDGLVVLLEAAPSRSNRRCNTEVFVARSEQEYLEAFAATGLRCLAIEAVDPAPFKTWFLPWYSRLPRPLAVATLFAVTIAALPIDLLTVRWGRAASWHKVFALTHSGDRRR